MQPEPYWASDDGDVQLHLGDCLDVLRTLPADSVDAIVTDPPTRPRLLDLFCCEGAAAMGYHLAGFDVTGIDNRPQPRYPFRFVQADALDFPLDGFDVIHASPPCQDYSRAMRHLASGYPRLIGPVRERLKAAGVPWIIENVPGSGLPAQGTLDGAYGVELCGTMFRLPFRYHRLFETSFAIVASRGCDHSIRTLNPRYRSGPGRDTEAAWREAIGAAWTSQQGGREAVPVVYTEYIGGQLLETLKAAA